MHAVRYMCHAFDMPAAYTQQCIASSLVIRQRTLLCMSHVAVGNWLVHAAAAAVAPDTVL
jgi:hypothetical protein